ncbi:MAG TPA: WXG100 family type VII secretion target [Anaerolineales bacterium]|nr:WXG100 family type VII secretion target [Anaerolineales bacterium]
MAPVLSLFQASHDELPRISKGFRSESNRVKATIDRLNRVIQVLEGGDWIGEGATAFYNEMRTEVIPAMKRLMNALEMGASVTQQINQLVDELEQTTLGFFAVILASFEGGSAGAGASAGAGVGGQAPVSGGGGGGGSSSSSEQAGAGGGSGGSAGGGGAGGGGGGGSWDGEIGFRQEKPGPGGGKPPGRSGRRRSSS